MTTAVSKKYKYHKYIDDYIFIVESGKIRTCEEQKQLIVYVKRMLDRDDVVIDEKAINESVDVPAPYFSFELFPWEKFLNALKYGVRYTNGELVWTEFLELLGRGAGKTAYAAYESFYMLTSYHGIKNYDVEIVATSEEQAERTFSDVHSALEDEKQVEKLRRAFKWTKTIIQHKKTKSVMKYNTSNAKTKDGKRAGCVFFDETHEYLDYKNITVYTTSQGKVEDSRIIHTTTDGYVRGGPLDDLKEKAKMVLNGELDELGFLPFICRLDSDDEVNDPANWEKANPSLPYRQTLFNTIKKEFESAKLNSALWMELMTKRMNRPQIDVRREVASYESRLATDQPLPDMSIRREAIGGLDFSDTRDFTSVGILFKDGDKVYWIQHTFIHQIALETQNIKREIIELAESKGLCTIVRNTPSIGHERVVNWFLEMAKKFNIKKIALDTYRSTVIGPALKEAGFEIDIVRRGPATHAMLAPLIDDLFINEKIVFHDDPLMRWYVGNVYVDEKGNGNKEYLKIDKDTRKTDGFFAFTHALNFEADLKKPRKLRVYKSISI